MNYVKCCSFLEEFLFLMTYQSCEESASISNLLKNKGKWYKKKGFKGMKVNGAMDADYG